MPTQHRRIHESPAIREKRLATQRARYQKMKSERPDWYTKERDRVARKNRLQIEAKEELMRRHRDEYRAIYKALDESYELEIIGETTVPEHARYQYRLKAR